jgi:hypothetical protein
VRGLDLEAFGVSFLMVSGSGSPGGDAQSREVVLKACLACSWKARGESRALVAEGRCEGRKSDAMVRLTRLSMVDYNERYNSLEQTDCPRK